MPDRPRPRPNNVGASVRQRLLNLAHARGQPMELLLTRYALERLLHRLSLSPHRDRFVLKGAMLLATWFDEPHRATRDVDLLGFGDPAHDALLGTFREVMAIETDDGVSFDVKGLRIEAIREEVEYGGSRLRTTAALAGARVPITVDIGFGDAVEPGVEDIDLPVLLDMPSPHLRAYPRRGSRSARVHRRSWPPRRLSAHRQTACSSSPRRSTGGQCRPRSQPRPSPGCSCSAVWAP
jgi:hypothetical protein